MSSTLENYMNEQSLERITHTIIENFEEGTGHTLTDDEREYAFNVTKETFYTYTFDSHEEIQVADEKAKEKLDEILELLVKNISNLIVNFVYALIQSYVYEKRVRVLERIIKDRD